MRSEKQIKKWTTENAMDRTRGNSIPPSYPNEVMVKIFSSSEYSSGFSTIDPGSSVLDVGCAFGNNLVYFLDRDCVGYGIDVTNDMVNLAKGNLKRLGYGDVKIEKGSNEAIPFPDGSFDILISVNTLHYSQGIVGINKALAEFSRVVTNGGKVFIMTAGPRHKIVQNSKRHNLLDWEVLDFGFRTSDRLSFFDDTVHFKAVLSEHFDNVEVGSLTEDYSTSTLDFMFSMCNNK
jgi:ubiquinone/menaquinone biosynthesis C-methylase UbiE